MAGKIFINYRRDDVPGDARGIRDALAGKSNIFMDVDNLLAGQRFDRELDKALSSCDVLLAVMGPRWMDLLTARTKAGERDYMREEIAAALKRDIVVIPVRVGQGGQMSPLPRGGDLPEDIRDFVLHQKHDVTHERFGRDIADLIEAIRAVRKGERRPTPWARIAAVVVAVLLLGSGALAYMSGMPWLNGPAIEEGTDARARQKVAAAEAERKRAATKAEEGRRAEAEAKQKADAEAEAAKKRADAAAAEIKPGSVFRDCPECPEMVVVPAGDFMMGSPVGEEGRSPDEGPQHKVSIARPFAVGKFEVTLPSGSLALQMAAARAIGTRRTRLGDAASGR